MSTLDIGQEYQCKTIQSNKVKVEIQIMLYTCRMSIVDLEYSEGGFRYLDVAVQ